MGREWGDGELNIVAVEGSAKRKPTRLEHAGGNTLSSDQSSKHSISMRLVWLGPQCGRKAAAAAAAAWRPLSRAPTADTVELGSNGYFTVGMEPVGLLLGNRHNAQTLAPDHLLS